VENENAPRTNLSDKRVAESPIKSKLLPKNSIELDIENGGTNNEEDSVEEQMVPIRKPGAISKLKSGVGNNEEQGVEVHKTGKIMKTVNKTITRLPK
jgi:hypothetical protein